jgi:ribosomal protein L40E
MLMDNNPTHKMVELIQRNPELLKEEQIIDTITGVNVSPNYDRSNIVQIFGMDEYAYGNDMGLTLTPTRIILYYIDEANNHQLRAYPITDIEDITISSLAFSKKKLAKLYMDESHVSMKTNKDENLEGFITHVQQLTLSQPSRIPELNIQESNNMVENNFIYCMKCGTKLPNDASFCMKCGLEFSKEAKMCCVSSGKTIQNSSTASKPSGAWYLVPILFGFLGGTVGYFAVKDDNKNMAEDLIVIGIIVSIISFFIFMMLI